MFLSVRATALLTLLAVATTAAPLGNRHLLDSSASASASASSSGGGQSSAAASAQAVSGGGGSASAAASASASSGSGGGGCTGDNCGGGGNNGGCTGNNCGGGGDCGGNGCTPPAPPPQQPSGCGSTVLRIKNSLRCNTFNHVTFADDTFQDYLIDAGTEQDHTITYCPGSTLTISARTVGSGTFGCPGPVPPETTCSGFSSTPFVFNNNVIAFNTIIQNGNGCQMLAVG